MLLVFVLVPILFSVAGSDRILVRSIHVRPNKDGIYDTNKDAPCGEYIYGRLQARLSMIYIEESKIPDLRQQTFEHIHMEKPTINEMVKRFLHDTVHWLRHAHKQGLMKSAKSPRDCGTCRKEIAEKRKIISEKKLKVKSVTKKLIAAEEEIPDLERINSALNSELLAHDDEIKKLEVELEELNADFTKIQGETQTLSAEIRQKMAKAVEYEDEFLKLLEQADAQKKELENLKKQCKHEEKKAARDCKVKHGSTIGLQVIDLEEFGEITTACDISLPGLPYTVIQRRTFNEENFHKGWKDYVHGFGDLEKSFWMGLDKVYAMTSSSKQYELYITLTDDKKETRHAKYDNFKIANEDKYFKLKSVGSYSGNAGDSLSAAVRAGFTTSDNMHYACPDNCSELFAGGWWFNYPLKSNLNGNGNEVECDPKDPQNECIFWSGWPEAKFQFVQMMIRGTEGSGERKSRKQRKRRNHRNHRNQRKNKNYRHHISRRTHRS